MEVGLVAPVERDKREPVGVEFQIERAGAVEVAKRLVMPFTTVESLLGASPKKLLDSMVKVPEMVVEAKVAPPDRVTDLAKTSPSASTMNLGRSPTAKPKRLVSLAAEAGLRSNEAPVTLESATSGAQVTKVCTAEGTLVTVNWVVTVEVLEMVREPSWAVKAPAMVTGPAKVEVPVPLTVRFPPTVVFPESVAFPETEKVPLDTARFPEETVKPFKAEASVKVSIFWDWLTMVMDDLAVDWA